MRVVIGADAAGDEQSFLALSSILRKIEEGWHVWEVTDPEALEESIFLKRNRILDEMHQQAAKRSVYPVSGMVHRKRVKVILEPCGEDELLPDTADKYLKTPLRVLMENRVSDGMFLDTVLQVLAPPEMSELLEITPSPMEKDSPGGNGQLPDLVDERISQSRKSGFPARIVVFTDSDARYPGDVRPSPKKIEEKCTARNVPFLILKKRTIENYIPDEAFDSWCIPTDRAAVSYVQALKRLDSVQRDHYPVKKGFQQIDTMSWTDEEKQLYDTVSNEDMKTLQNRCMKEPIDLLTRERAALTPETLRRRDGSGELDRLVRMIAENL